jgi:hypothetical protein
MLAAFDELTHPDAFGGAPSGPTPATMLELDRSRRGEGALLEESES